MAETNVFETLHAVDVSKKVKTKGGLTYLSWSSAWAEVKKNFPDATFKIYPQIIDDGGNTRFWHDDGRTGQVEVGVTINGEEIIETLAIMDFKNKSIPSADITSVDANKSLKRCLVKACAMHGLGLYIYEGEDVPEETAKVKELKGKISVLVSKKCAISTKAKDRVATLCKEAEKKANPNIEDEFITGQYNNIDDVDILQELETKLKAIR